MPPVTIAVANQKGGVGKTTTAVNLSSALARKGFRVLILDADPQGHATLATVGRLPADTPTIGKVLLAQVLAQMQGAKAEPALKLEQIIVTTSTPGVWLAPGARDSLDADATIYRLTIAREKCMSRALKSLPPNAFDLIILDTSPFVGQLTINALVAAQRVLVPVSAEYLPLTGLNDLTGHLDVLREAEIPVSVLGYVVTFLDKRITSQVEILKMLADAYGSLVFETKIRTNANLKVIPAFHQDIFEYEAKQHKPWKGIDDYSDLADEVITRLGAALPAPSAASKQEVI